MDTQPEDRHLVAKSARRGSRLMEASTPANEFLQIVPGFVSKHVRQHCLSLAKIRLRRQSKHGFVREPTAEPCFAAVMMADVSGYSSLSSALAEMGPAGAETMGRIMKGYLDKIIATIVTYEGDIVKFAGDAVIVYWKLDNPDIETDILRGELVLKAAYCCMDLLNSLGTYDIDVPGCPTKVLRLHLGIGAGQVFDVHVGGGSSGRWEHFVAGEGVRQLSQVLDLAKAGELAMSHTALKFLSAVIDIETMNLGGYDKRCIIIHGLEKARRKIPRSNNLVRETIVELDPRIFTDLYQSYINTSALFKLQADINQSYLFRMQATLTNLLNLHELRQLTTVFIKVDSSLARWERKDCLILAQEVMTIVQKSLQKYEGSLRQFHVDDKGAVMLAFFGLPPFAHQNDASHGVRAALEIRDDLLDKLDEFAIGVSTGVVSIGGVGFQNRTEYAVMGDSINMAARLMCLPSARNSFLCDEKTYELCKTEFYFEQLGESKVKGKANPIRIFRPLGGKGGSKLQDEQKQALEDVEPIGRQKERRIIAAAIESFNEEVGAGVVVFEGDGGQGLTTLAAHTRAISRSQNCLVCSTSGTEMEKCTPFFAIRNLVADLVHIIEGIHDIEINVVKCSIEGSSEVLGSVRRLSTRKATNSNLEPELPISRGRKSLVPAPIWQSSSSIGSDLSISIKSKSKKKKAKAEGIPAILKNTPTPSENSLKARLKGALAKINEAPQVIQLFDLVMPADFFDKGSLAAIEPQQQNQQKIRIKELQALLIRMLTAIIKSHNLVLIFQETQWVDHKSLEILWEIVNTCPQIVVFIFSRPEKSFDNEDCSRILRKIKRLMRSVPVLVEGLSLEETKELIIHSWTGQSVSNVDEQVLEKVYTRSNGNPLYIMSLMSSLKESGQWYLDSTNTLFIRSESFDFDKVVVGFDLQSTLVAQFDKLDRNFQLLLKVASVAGQRFSIDDVFFFLKNLPGMIDQFKYPNYVEVASKVADLDKYGYLHVVPETHKIQMEFKSAVVKSSIYSMMIESQRQQLHLSLAQYYEQMLTPSSPAALLRKTYFHYMETDSSQESKKIEYLEKVAHSYYAGRMIHETIKHYHMLLDWVGTEPDHDIYDKIRCAQWFRELGECYFQRREIEKAREHLLTSLRLLNCKLPKNKIHMWYLLQKEMLVRTRYSIPSTADSGSTLPFQATSWAQSVQNGAPSHTAPTLRRQHRAGVGSINSLSETNTSTFFLALTQASAQQNEPTDIDDVIKVTQVSRESIRLASLKEVLMTLSHIFLLTEKTQDCKYTIFLGINIAEHFPKSTSYAKFLALLGYVWWVFHNRKKLALRCLDGADRTDDKSDFTTSIAILMLTGETLFLMGLLNEAGARYQAVLLLNPISNDIVHREEAMRMQSVTSFFSGPLVASANIARDLYAVANQEDRWFGKFWGSYIVLANLLVTVSSTEEIRDMRGTLEALWTSAPPDHAQSPQYRVAKIGLLALCDFVLGRGMSPIELWQELENDLKGLKGHNWIGVLGGLFIIILLDLVRSSSGLPTEPVARKSVSNLVKAFAQVFGGMTSALAKPLHALFYGFERMMADKRVQAVRRLKAGLAYPDAKELVYLQALLHERVYLASDDQETAREHLVDAQKMFRKIGATADFERLASH